MKFGDLVKVKSLDSPVGFKENLERLGLAIPCDETLESGPQSVMSQSLKIGRLLVVVMHHLALVRDLKARFPHLLFDGSGYTYLQEFTPYVAQAVVRAGWTDLVGLGRMMLSYPELIADVLAGRSLKRKRICRNFSDCTTASRNGMISGCYPLDAHDKKFPQLVRLTQVKKDAKLA